MRKFFFFVLVSAVAGNAFSQTVPEKIVAALDSFSVIRPQEKTYIQTDRNSYLAGETSWFKIYALLQGKPTVLSKLVYIELADANGKLLQKKMLKLQDGAAKGSIDLATDMPQGNYYLRCYTMWMLNFPAFITEKKILVINNEKGSKTPVAAKGQNINVIFFPEGGQLTQGLKSIVAFKALDEQGRPLTVNGDIVNAKNEKLASFTSEHDGMGTFELAVPANTALSAVVRYGNGKQKTVALPAARAEGINLSIDNSNAGKTFARVERSEANKAIYNELTIVAQLNYQMVYMAKLNIDEGQDAVAINKKNLPSGIMQVTVLSMQGIPLAERIVFVGNHKIDNSALNADTVNISKRKKNVFSFNSADYTNLQASASVINVDADGIMNGSNILSTLLLSSDIKGNINEPGYYFKDQSPKTLQHLDLVMLTNGWRRYNLPEIMEGKYSQLFFPFETSLSITGKVLQANGKTALKAGKINMVIKGEDSTTIMAEAKLDAASVFIVNDIEFQKEATVYYQGSNLEKTNAVVSVQVNPSYFDTLQASKLNYAEKLEDLKPNGFFEDQLEEKARLDKVKMLSNVTVTATKRSPTDSLNNLYASPSFFDSDQTLALNQNINYNDLWRYLQAQIPGININRTDTGTQVLFNRYMGTGFFSETDGAGGVQFFLNEVPVSVDVIDLVDITDVAMVKIYKGNTAIALGAIRGAIAVYTVKGKSSRDWRQKGFDFVKRPGYSVNREFYEMDYSKLNSQSLFTDIRPTIYWNPELKSKNGKTMIEFYNDDVCKKFRIVVEGVDANGKLLHLEKLVE